MNIAAKILKVFVFRQAFEIMRPDFLTGFKINKIRVFFSSLIEFYKNLNKIVTYQSKLWSGFDSQIEREGGKEKPGGNGGGQ